MGFPCSNAVGLMVGTTVSEMALMSLPVFFNLTRQFCWLAARAHCYRTSVTTTRRPSFFFNCTRLRRSQQRAQWYLTLGPRCWLRHRKWYGQMWSLVWCSIASCHVSVYIAWTPSLSALGSLFFVSMVLGLSKERDEMYKLRRRR